MKKRASEKNNRYVLLVWALVWINFVTQYWFDGTPLEAVLASSSFVLSTYPFTTYLSTTLLGRAMRTKKWNVFMVQFLLISLAFGTVLYGLIQFWGYLEIAGFFGDSELFSQMGVPLHEIVNISLAAVVINFGFCGLRFFEANIRLQKELHESQLRTLNGQINPHSMFNVLNHIHVLLGKDPWAADDLLLKYSEILRYQLYNAGKDKVTLRQDTDYLKQYIEVEKIRWKNKIAVTQEWNIEDECIEVPPLLFVSFLENAFKYVSRSDSEKGYVEIAFSQSGETITFSVKNSRSEIGPGVREGTGLGLPNIRKRLDILFPARHELKITDPEDHYSVHLTLTI